MRPSHPILRTWMILSVCTIAVRAAEPAANTPSLQIVGGPYLQAPSPTSMTIVWTTNNKCVSKVEYGTEPGEMKQTAVSAHYGLVDANITLHRITIKGLQPGKTYYYRAVSKQITEFEPYKVTYGPTVSKEAQFTTLDPTKDSFSFCMINDRHDHVPELRQALAAIKWPGIDLVFGVGDVMNNPMTEQQIFQNFLNPCVEVFASRIPLVLVRGNHETRGTLARDLIDYYPTESGRFYYSFDHGGVHFLLLDGGEDKGDANVEYSGLAAFEGYVNEQTAWLEQELQSDAFRRARFRVCLLHIPPAPEGKNDAKFMRAPWIRDHWMPMLSKAGVDLMLSGHTHKYTEVPPTDTRAFPIVVGGTNTVVRVDVSPEKLDLTSFNDDGTLLSKPPSVSRKR